MQSFSGPWDGTDLPKLLLLALLWSKPSGKHLVLTSTSRFSAFLQVFLLNPLFFLFLWCPTGLRPGSPLIHFIAAVFGTGNLILALICCWYPVFHLRNVIKLRFIVSVEELSKSSLNHLSSSNRRSPDLLMSLHWLTRLLGASLKSSASHTEHWTVFVWMFFFFYPLSKCIIISDYFL